MTPTIQMDTNQLNQMMFVVREVEMKLSVKDTLTDYEDYMLEKADVLGFELEEGSYDDITMCDFFELSRYARHMDTVLADLPY